MPCEMTDKKSIQPSWKLTGISCSSWKKKTEKRSVQAGLRTTKMKADSKLRGEEKEEQESLMTLLGELTCNSAELNLTRHRCAFLTVGRGV